jgi:hypothetical protein
LLSQSVGCFEAAVVDLLSHPLGQRSADFSVRCCRVLGASGRDIAVNAVCFPSSARWRGLKRVEAAKGEMAKQVTVDRKNATRPPGEDRRPVIVALRGS